MTTTDSTPAESNRREFTRVEVELLVRLKVEEEWYETDIVQDISLNGFQVEFEEDVELPSNSQIKAQLFIGGVESGVVVEVMGDAVRVKGGRVAVEITEIYGPEALEHLKKLVRYNSPDAAKVDEEFASHLGIKRP